MDEEVALFMLLVLVMLFALTVFAESAYFGAPAAEEAQNICIQRGFDNYKSYSRPPFSTKPYGVQCEYVNRYIIDRDGNVLVDARK